MRTILYEHAGSGNHGCEAIINSTLLLLKKEAKRVSREDGQYEAPYIISSRPDEDRRYTPGRLEEEGLCRIVSERRIEEDKPAHIAYYILRKITGDRESYLRYRFRNALELLAGDTPGDGKAYDGRPLALAIGGDNYCYPQMVPDLMLAHGMFKKRGCRTVLYGCSVEPDSLGDKALRDDLSSYDRVIARESVTYNALLEAGIPGERLSLSHDPAFTLSKAAVPLPEGFEEGHTVGINLSPMARDLESSSGITMENYEALIRHILLHGDEKIALIPHVVWESNDDRRLLISLYDRFRDSGRLIFVSDHDCEVLKRYISACSVFVGARTHATIAAYSSLVPTLVLGYSVKSRGIATDIFGTDEGYVLPVQSLENPDDLVKAYERISSERDGIRSKLESVMPEYISGVSLEGVYGG